MAVDAAKPDAVAKWTESTHAPARYALATGVDARERGTMNFGL